MADREKVIKGLADISEYARAKADIAGIGKGKEVFDSYYRAAEDAIALLREQEPVKPEPREIWVGSNGAFLLEWHCGACGCGVMKNDRWQAKFCPECGRKVKWE